MTTEQGASTEQISKESVSNTTPAVSTEKPSTEASVPPQTLTEDSIKKRISEALEEGKALGRREMQAIKDREVASEKRKAENAEKRAKIYEGSFTDLDEDTRDKLELRRIKSENELYRNREQEESLAKQQEENSKKLEQSLKDEVTLLGIDPADKRIDYANDAKDYFEGRKRFSESLSKIVKENKDNLEKTLKESAEARFKQMETEFRKKYGLDSQDTTTSKGVVNQSDADFMRDWGNYTLPNTPENRKRYEELKKKYY